MLPLSRKATFARENRDKQSARKQPNEKEDRKNSGTRKGTAYKRDNGLARAVSLKACLFQPGSVAGR